MAQSPLRIAIADDNPAFLAAAAGYVANLPGYVLVGTSGNAAEALALIQSTAPDVLLLDLGSIPVRGLEIVRRVKAVPHAPAVIALSLFRSEEAAIQAQGAGAVALIGKEAFVTGLAEVLPRLLSAAEAA